MDPWGSLLLAGLLVLGALILYHGYRYEKALWQKLSESRLPRVDLGDGDVMIIRGEVMFRCPEKHHVKLDEAIVIVDSYDKKMYLLCPHDYQTMLTIDLEDKAKTLAQGVRDEAKKRIRRKAKKTQ